MDVPLYTTVFTYNINLDTYNSMSPAQKKVIDDHCTPEWAAKVTDPWTDFEFAGRVKMKALPDHEVYQLTPEQLAQWKEAVKPLHASWATAVKKAGGDPVEIEADLQAAIEEIRRGAVSLASTLCASDDSRAGRWLRASHDASDDSLANTATTAA